jgi:23S rRNA (pseudouridine1915-N3)-methyltransferase
MKVELWAIGKTSEKYLETGIAVFEKRLGHYLPFSLLEIPDVKKQKDSVILRHEEGQRILGKLSGDDCLILLDERGKQFTSTEFAGWIERKLAGHGKKMIFLIGGAYGFSPDIYARANDKISLSSMTFSHQMIRLFFVEQLYRAMTILKNEPYHNE